MKKLITSLACGTVLSMSLLGAGHAVNAAGTGGMGTAVPDTGMNGLKTENRTGNTMGGMGTGTGGPLLNQDDNNLLNRTTGTTRNNDSIMNDKMRTGTGTNGMMTQYPDASRGTKYRATSTTTNATNNDDNGSNWGWLGLVGLLGLAGMRNKSGERERR